MEEEQGGPVPRRVGRDGEGDGRARDGHPPEQHPPRQDVNRLSLEIRRERQWAIAERERFVGTQSHDGRSVL